jgi:hypothetical protein
MGMGLQSAQGLPHPAKKLSSPEKLRGQDRQPQRNDQDGRAWKHDECDAESYDTETDHGHHAFPDGVNRGIRGGATPQVLWSAVPNVVWRRSTRRNAAIGFPHRENMGLGRTLDDKEVSAFVVAKPDCVCGRKTRPVGGAPVREVDDYMFR